MRTSLAAAFSALLVVAGPVSASNMEITAMGRVHQDRAWLTWDGPDASGLYTMRVSIADLDPATPQGWQTMSDRVYLGTWKLCNAAGAEPRIAGYYDGVQRGCWRETRTAARVQMDQARSEAMSGRHQAFLSIAHR